MKSSLLVPCALLLLGPAPGQAVFPVRYAGVSSYQDHLAPFSVVAARSMFLYAEPKGRALTIREIGFRRVPTTRVGRDVFADVTVRMGPTDFARPSPVFANNFTAPPTTVFQSGSLRVPDWRQAPPSNPAPFDVVVPLSQSYMHSGAEHLALDFSVSNRVPASYGMEGVREADLRKGSQINLGLGLGCRSPLSNLYNHQMGVWFAPRPVGVEVFLQTSFAQRNAAGLYLLGVRDPDIAVPGFCASLRSSGEIVLPFRTGPGGDDRASFQTGPLIPPIAGAVVFQQSLVRDGAGWFTMSNGTRLQIPDPNPPAVPVLSILGAGLNPSTGILGGPAGPVVQFR